MQPPAPMILELAPLGRQQMGPFLILGLDKNCDKEAVEAGWAQRLIRARKNQIKTPLEDINWAREALADPSRKLQGDASSLNLETTAGTFAKLGQPRRGCQPIDVEKDLSGTGLPVSLPDGDELLQSIKLPDLPREVPTIQSLLEEFVRQPLDPWSVE